MFIIIPVTIALCASLGMVFMVYRKMPYLKKLTPENVTGTFLQDMAPELKDVFSPVKLRSYRDSLLLDAEKLLRRVRLVFLKFDAASESLIKKIRKSHLSVPVTSPAAVPATPAPEVQAAPAKRKGGRRVSDKELKEQEQNLIMTIAKSPKDITLYIALGEVYMKMGNFDDAKEAFEAALKLDEENEKAVSKLDKAMHKIDAA